MQSRPYRLLDESEYLTLEARSPVRHEYVAGEIFAMTGASVRHNIIALNLATALRTHLRGTPCRALMEGVKLYLKKERSYFYPDVMVTCDERDRRAELAIEHPKLIVEVLSDSTAAYDRGVKFAAYRKLADLQEYLIVDIAQRRLELYRRAADHWLMFDSAGDGPALQLQSVDMPLSPAEAFEDLDDQP